MPVHFIQPPAAATQAFHAALPELAARPSVQLNAPVIAAAVERAAPAPDDASVPAPVHVAGLKELAAGGDVRAAPLTLWTHLLHDGGTSAPRAAADVDARTMRFAAVSQGDDVESLGANVREAQRAGAGGGADYDLAVVRVPALYLSAVWLKGRNGAEDVLIPGDSPKSPFKAGQRYSPAEFNAGLKVAAERELSQDDGVKGG